MANPLNLFLAWSLLAVDAPQFVVHTADGKDIVGLLKKIDPNGDVRIGGDQPVLIDADRVVSISSPTPWPPHPIKNALVLANGDVLALAPGGKVTLSEDVLQIECAQLRRKSGLLVRVPVTFAAILWFDVPEGSDEQATQLLRQLWQAKRVHDVVLLNNGDRVEGTVSAIAETGCVVGMGTQQTKVPLNQIAAVAFNSELRARVQPRKLYSQLTLSDGTRLGLATLELAADRLVGKTFFGEQIESPLTSVAAIDYRLGVAVYLSDLEPKAYQHTPFLGSERPLARDISVSGQPLQIKSHIYDKGLGTQPRTAVTYLLDGKYRWFETAVGLNAGARFGSARVRIVVDGKDVWGRELDARSEPAVARIDVRKASEITLVVDFADFGNVQAHVDWGDARLIR